MAANSLAMGQESVRRTTYWTLALLAAFCILSIPSRGQTPAGIGPKGRVALIGQRAPWALPQVSQGPVPGNTMLEHLTLVLKRSPQRQRAFKQFLQQQQDPASP